jgi:hypothetical protein
MVMDRADEHKGESRRPVRPSLSACIIACDEAARLPGCLASLAFCDEIVLVDSGSLDETVELARAGGARVISQPWLGFAAQRNVALDHANGDWVIEIDADERVSPELRAEIEAFLELAPAGVELGAFPLRDMLLGHRLGPSAKYPKYRHRLLLRGAYRHDERRLVHEGLIPAGPVQPFTGDLEHLLAESWREAVGDAWRYARLEAGQLNAQRTPRAALAGLLVRPALKFVYRLTIDGGWRDGPYGWAKIGLDCASDSMVWLRHLSGRRGDQSGDSGTSSREHYGTRGHRGGARVVGLAFGSPAIGRASSWLDQAREQGMDVALIADGASGAGAPRVRRLRRARPLELLRCLEAEQQLRRIDAVIPFGLRARLLLRIAPGRLHGIVRRVSEQEQPSSVAARIEGRRRSGAAEEEAASSAGGLGAPASGA